MLRALTATLLILCLTLLPSCGGAGQGEHAHDDHDHDAHADAFKDVKKAVCVLASTQGNSAAGVITFTQTKDGLLVEAEVSGLTPNALHGFHVHEFGDITAADGNATGGHYNPEQVDHGLPTHQEGESHAATGGHAGDFGNLEADANGVAKYSKTFNNITLTGKNAVIGRGIIVHAKPDDGGQPTGNAGPRIAQGVIGIAKSE